MKLHQVRCYQMRAHVSQYVEVRRQSSWSEWLMATSVTDVQGRREQKRLRCVCRAEGGHGQSRRLRRPSLRVQSRHCYATNSSSLSTAEPLCDSPSTRSAHVPKNAILLHSDTVLH